MTDQYLSCNLQNCGKRLNEDAYVTTCSHIFCVEHGKKSLQNKVQPECMVCHTKFDKELDFVVINLNPNEQYKSMILTGLHPDIALEIASRSISYYIYQISFDNKNKDNIIKQMKKQNVEIKKYCQKLNVKHKHNLMEAQATINSVEKELEEKAKEIESVKYQLSEANRYIKRLQMQVSMCKREITALKVQNEAVDNNSNKLFFDNKGIITTPKFNFRTMINENTNVTNIFDINNLQTYPQSPKRRLF